MQKGCWIAIKASVRQMGNVGGCACLRMGAGSTLIMGAIISRSDLQGCLLPGIPSVRLFQEPTSRNRACTRLSNIFMNTVRKNRVVETVENFYHWAEWWKTFNFNNPALKS